MAKLRHDPSDDQTAPEGRPLDAADLGYAPTKNQDPLVGELLGEYRVLSLLGHGGMGKLYRGVQPVIDKPVAIKVVLKEIASDEVVAQRMLEEARAANAVRHPGIVDIFAFGTLPDGRPYMVMELLEGEALAEVLNRHQRLSAQQTLTVLAQAMAALEAAHAKGVVHRDLKPENIFVSEGRDGWRIKIIDFGLAKREGNQSRLTRPGFVMGTPGFMAPEQVRGDANVSGAADVYAMGVVAWTLLMGHEPFLADSVVEVMHQHLSAPIPALGPEAAARPPGLDRLIERMMAKKPELRPTATEVRLEVAALQQAPARVEPRAPRPVKPLVGIGATLLAMGVVSALLYFLLREPEAVPVVTAPPPVLATRPASPPVQPVEKVEPPPSPGKKRRDPAEKVWACDSIDTVSPVNVDAFAKQISFFSVRFQHERELTVHVETTRKGMAAMIQRRREQVAACRGGKKVLVGRRVDPNHTPLHTSLTNVYGGDMVMVEDLRVDDP
ncbi:MAG: serine/threonine protein kinase [Archangiaceae bacterium]|nr:serine/threonine protein kinase [Archangiaceae bacterium]